MNGNEVALAAIALAATTIGGMIWIMKWGAREVAHDLKEHTKAATIQTEASREMLDFMKNLNGRLRKSVASTLEDNKKERRR